MNPITTYCIKSYSLYEIPIQEFLRRKKDQNEIFNYTNNCRRKNNTIGRMFAIPKLFDIYISPMFETNLMITSFSS